MEKLLQRLKINPTLHESSLCASVGLKSWLGVGCGSAAVILFTIKINIFILQKPPSFSEYSCFYDGFSNKN